MASGGYVAAQSLESLESEAAAMAGSPPAVLAIDGGDGTLHRTLTAVVRTWKDRPLPIIAVLAGGTMNVVAASLRLGSRPERSLAQLVAQLRAGHTPATVQRRCLRVQDTYGFVFGNGLMANFLEEYYARGGTGLGGRRGCCFARSARRSCGGGSRGGSSGASQGASASTGSPCPGTR